jgi:glycosyltransferase involved in cell wall biosynthesis
MVEYKGFSVNFISTWPPRICGIAKFTADTISAILYEHDILDWKVHPIEKEILTYLPPIKQKHIIRQMDSSSWIDSAEMIIERSHRNDPKGIKTVAVLEHEYGLDGNGISDNNYNEVAKRFKNAGVPNIVVLHTILENPNDYQKEVIQQFGENCDRMVAITPSSNDILRRVYGIDEKKIVHIPHGIPESHKTVTRTDAKEKWGLEDRHVISTIGLVSEGKGIEYGIRGFSKFLKEINPDDREKTVYLIAGQSHPETLKEHGGMDPYRKILYDTAEDEGLNPVAITHMGPLKYPDNDVILLNRYLMDNEYIELTKASDVALLPYLNPEQISSGTLAYAVGLGRTVVSTEFRYAQDVFSDERGHPDGSGVLIGFKDEDEVAKGLRYAFENLREIEVKAYQKGVTMGWSVVRKQMINLLYNVAMDPSEIESATISFVE